MRTPRCLPLVMLALLAAAVPGAPACSSSPDELDDPDLPLVPTNPDGVPYPTDHIGGGKRQCGIVQRCSASMPARPGDRMPNTTFRAYRDDPSSPTRTLQTVSLAEYFDPGQKRNKVLHIQIAATWCSVCSAELAATVTVTEPLRKRGVVFLEVVVSGKTLDRGPSLDDVNQWIDQHRTNFPTGIDVRGRRLGALGVSTAAMPHDILLDTRTMEILDSSVGAPLDVGKYVLAALDLVTTSPPAY